VKNSCLLHSFAPYAALTNGYPRQFASGPHHALFSSVLNYSTPCYSGPGFLHKDLLMPPYLDLFYLLPDRVWSRASHTALPDTSVLICCAICHVNPQFMACLVLTYRALCDPRLPTPNRTHFTTDLLRAQPAALCPGSQSQLGETHPNTGFQYLFASPVEGHSRVKKWCYEGRENVWCNCSPSTLDLQGSLSYSACSTPGQ